MQEIFRDVTTEVMIFRFLRERPLMTSDSRVGRGVQNDPKIGHFRVENGR